MRVFSAKDDKIAIECDNCKKVYNFSKQYFSAISKEGCVTNVDIICPNCKNRALAGTFICGNARPFNNHSAPSNNNNRTSSNSGCLTAIIILIIILVLAMIGSGIESDYERAGKEFETWIGEDPRTWTDTEKQYFEDFWQWADKN